jgi:hypothetical protein
MLNQSGYVALSEFAYVPEAVTVADVIDDVLDGNPPVKVPATPSEAPRVNNSTKYFFTPPYARRCFFVKMQHALQKTSNTTNIGSRELAPLRMGF